MSKYVTACHKFYQAFPHISTTSDKRWGEKAWVREYTHQAVVLTFVLRLGPRQQGRGCRSPELAPEVDSKVWVRERVVGTAT